MKRLIRTKLSRQFHIKLLFKFDKINDLYTIRSI